MLIQANTGVAVVDLFINGEAVASATAFNNTLTLTRTVEKIGLIEAQIIQPLGNPEQLTAYTTANLIVSKLQD